MARATRVSKTGFIWIKQNIYNPCVLVNITKEDSTIENVTSNLLNLNVVISANTSVASFGLSLINKDGFYTGMFDGGEAIEISLGFNDSFTKVFSGLIEKVSYSLNQDGYQLNLSGRDYGSLLLKRKVLESYEDKEVSTIITDSTTGLIPLYASTITTTNVSVTTTTIAGITFRGLTPFDCIKQLADKVGYNFFVDTDVDLNFFLKGSRICYTEAVVAGDNLLNIDMGTDITEIRNKITVYGANLDGDVQFIKTEEDSSSQSSYGISEEWIDDSSQDTMLKIQEKANNELETRKEPLNKGSVSCLGLPTLKAGDYLRISVPLCNVNGLYNVNTITHIFDVNSGFTTNLNIEEIKTDLLTDLKLRRLRESGLSQVDNPNKMTDSYVLKFDDETDIECHTDTYIYENSLRLAGSASDGTCVSVYKETDYTAGYCELRVDGIDLNDSKFYVTFDDGAHYQQLTNKTLTTITNTGTKIRIKSELIVGTNTPVPTVNHIGVSYKEA